MQERGVLVDHVTVHRWAMKIAAGAGRRVLKAQATSWTELESG